MENLTSDQKEEFGLLKALSYLEDGYILSAISEKRRNYFKKKGEKILVASGDFKASLSLDDFKRLYKEAIFSLVEDDEPICDPEKDEQYYSWGKEM
ncbi:MAG: hypothetical protein LKJ88_05255 [Bacilli bacterium]|jgi:hypothetical protein|nr:hypothetical protein [Bacilli bacterium]